MLQVSLRDAARLWHNFPVVLEFFFSHSRVRHNAMKGTVCLFFLGCVGILEVGDVADLFSGTDQL